MTDHPAPTRTARALAVLAAHPDGLSTPQIAQILGEYPQAMVALRSALVKQEDRGNVTGTYIRGYRLVNHWKITEQGRKLVSAAKVTP
jgi:hypothetical protein